MYWEMVTLATPAASKKSFGKLSWEWNRHLKGSAGWDTSNRAESCALMSVVILHGLLCW